MNHYAVAITALEKAELLDAGAFQELKPNEIRGRTLFSLISPGTELAFCYCGKNFPSYPGYAAVFIAEEIGSEVKDVEKGTVLFCHGSHRSLQQTDRMNVVKVPAGLAPEKAVIARLSGISMTTLMTTAARPGDLVIVSGAGPVGYLAAQIFSISGYEVLIVEPDADRRELAGKASGLKAFDRIPLDDKSVAGNAALVVECSGHEQAVLDACKAVRKRGEVVMVGVPWRRNTGIYAHELLHEIFHKYVILRSGWEWWIPVQSSDFSPHSIYSGYQTALGWLAEGKVKIDGLSTLIDPRNPQIIYQDLLNRRATGLFQIFDWSRI
ncbi:MAG: zinc-binding dehydrogenase [Victivallaceae bacterium]